MIEVERLTKRYGPAVAVGDVSFACRPGTVTGFLGPNGAGKSTTMRMICGLTPASSGTATVLGVPFRSLPNPGRHVGVLLDASAQHAGRTGRETLALTARLLGVPSSRADELLETVGLAGKPAGRRVGDYSLGMRQRLGIAQALVGDPSVLILDEPANGLDPEGIYWMRTLLRGFADRGGTVLLSSHLLHEVEAVADTLVVIAGGRVVASGTKSELLAPTGRTLVRALDPAALYTALVSAGLTVIRREPPTSDGTGEGFVVEAPAEAVGRAAAASGAVLVELRQASGGGLEELFLTLTGRQAAGAVPSVPSSAPQEVLR
ncbi:ABC transporter ATP-binding protein [Actinomadura rupiterrae]|uniref:ABC transporter ATP-binding protein n=1 Tax=Actinomadura rupiterrae TaxID=559627 RepID=UPI0020A41C2E|nr:ATP-binding cassette domain-containing protein [Actinomadura rupiterrae]MCP2341245.1 ABC-2 type transport system ATP-binding protein [Actinomadura rupiterrae]